MRPAKGLVLAIIDGLTPGALERGLAAGTLPALAALADAGAYRRGTTVFPSLTPVCLSSIATGSHPDGHGIPHLVWYHRGEGRIVEYGSSFAAMRAAGATRALRDSVFEMSQAHLSRDAVTVFEALEDEGLSPAAINFTCYRGRTRHRLKLRVPARNRWYEAVYGPRRFFFFNLFESDVTGAPLAVRSRVTGSIDAYAAAIGRWLVTRDGFDFLVFYLPDYDFASHTAGPDGSYEALARADASIGRLLDAAGGIDEFLDRYAVVVCSDHGQSPSARVARLQDAFSDLAVYGGRRDGDPARADLVVTASNRAGMVYTLPSCPLGVRALAQRLETEPAADVVLFREAGAAVARHGREELRFAPSGCGWTLDGEASVLDQDRYPKGLERAWRALLCPNAGEILVSAADGFEFADLGGSHHVGGGSHGSLAAADSTVPVLAAGFDADLLPDEPAVTDLAGLALEHFGVRVPASMRAPAPSHVA